MLTKIYLRLSPKTLTKLLLTNQKHEGGPAGFQKLHFLFYFSEATLVVMLHSDNYSKPLGALFGHKLFLNHIFAWTTLHTSFVAEKSLDTVEWCPRTWNDYSLHCLSYSFYRIQKKVLLIAALRADNIHGKIMILPFPRLQYNEGFQKEHLRNFSILDDVPLLHKLINRYLKKKKNRQN